MMKPRKFHPQGVALLAQQRTSATKGSTVSVLTTLCLHTGPDLLAWPSVGTLADLSKYSERAVRSSLKELRTLGEIEERKDQYVPRGNCRSKRYFIKICEGNWDVPSQITGHTNVQSIVTQQQQGNNPAKIAASNDVKVQTGLQTETFIPEAVAPKHIRTFEQSGADACEDAFIERFKEALESLNPDFAANWLRGIASVEVIDDTLVVTAMDSFYADQFRNQYADLIAGAAKMAGASFSRSESKHIGEARP